MVFAAFSGNLKLLTCNLKRVFGKDGGGTPFANITAVSAEQSANMMAIQC
ncbi:MAG: hypothetical protein LCI00_32350 [Chloroflexi bacterium]|nr:hypothetical protein [Chloroflexota bacterium]MCC6894200.1 hypothetical protein [Anaerolineae bacterium]